MYKLKIVQQFKKTKLGRERNSHRDIFSIEISPIQLKQIMDIVRKWIKL
jgi:hypothetical protein